MTHEKLSIIIPCYNEEEGIPQLVTQLTPTVEDLQKEYDVELLFIDDGSTDKTHQLLQEHYGKNKDSIIIKHTKNRNLGAAMKTGFHYASGNYIATIDSDCTYKPELLIQMLKMIDEETDIVTASPYHPQGKVENIPNYRLFLSKAICLIYRTITGTKIHTFTALFRVQKKDVVKNISFKSKNFLATAEMLIYALMKGYKVKEFPTTLMARKHGTSKMRLLIVIKSHAKFVLKLLKLRIMGELKT